MEPWITAFYAWVSRQANIDALVADLELLDVVFEQIQLGRPVAIGMVYQTLAATLRLQMVAMEQGFVEVEAAMRQAMQVLRGLSDAAYAEEHGLGRM